MTLFSVVFSMSWYTCNCHLLCSIVQEFDMLEEGDGDEQLVFLLLDLGSVVQDLLCDERLEGHQYFQFKEYFDSRGVRVCSEGNGSLTFQAAAAKIGPDKAALSLVLYLDGTYVLSNVDVRVLYCKKYFSSGQISLKFLILFPIYSNVKESGQLCGRTAGCMENFRPPASSQHSSKRMYEPKSKIFAKTEPVSQVLGYSCREDQCLLLRGSNSCLG